jgi:peroxiredoxin
MGLRSNRYSMLVRDGKVVTLNVEAPGKFEVSDANTLLAQAKGSAA